VDADKLLEGIKLEDGISKVDELSFVEPKDKSIVGLKIHSGKNRVIRRMFEALDHEVEHLDRVVFGGINKEGISRGKWRYLESYEIKKLKK
jgi:23S rRNA pseudouridine2605 synthase